jgi:hypothetical protein
MAYREHRNGETKTRRPEASAIRLEIKKRENGINRGRGGYRIPRVDVCHLMRQKKKLMGKRMKKTYRHGR